MIIVVLWAFVIQGFLVKGFPAGLYGDGETIADGVGLVKPVPAGDIVENNSTVVAIERVTLPESNKKLQEAILELSPVSSENNETKSIDLKTTINEPISVLSILAEDEGKINQPLSAEDEVIESKLEKQDKKIKQPSPKNANFNYVINSAIHDLIELQSNMASQLLSIKDTIESKMGVIRQKIKSAILENKMIAKAELNAKKISNDSVIIQPEIEMVPNMAKTNSLVKLDTEKGDCNSIPLKFEDDETLLIEEEEIEANLAKINDLIEFELAKIDSFVESELALTEALIQSEVEKMNLLVESKISTADLVDSEKTDVGSIVESELVKEIPVEGIAEFSGVVPATGRALIFGSTGYSPILPVLEENAEETVIEEETQRAEVPVVNEVPLPRIVPVSGRTFIFGSTGFLHPNLAPLETHSRKTMGRLNTIPISVETGPMTLGSTESSPPISKRPETTNESDFPKDFTMVSKFTPEFPETVIMDSTKNYERLIEEYEVLDQEMDHGGEVPVVGGVFFKGKAPAKGSVRITGHSIC